jgi:hypothetical protein
MIMIDCTTNCGTSQKNQVWQNLIRCAFAKTATISFASEIMKGNSTPWIGY